MAVLGYVRGLNNYYTDGVERQEIHVDKAESQGLPLVEGARVPITLIVNGERFNAGLRSTADCKYVWVCPDMTDANDCDVKLSHVLRAAGFVKNQRVELEPTSSVVEVRPSAS